MIVPFYFTDRNLKVGFKNNLNTQHINHANSKLTFTPDYPEFGIEIRYINKIVKEVFVIYARLINQYKFKYQRNFSATIDKQDQDSQVLDETKIINNLKINHNLTESDLDKIDVRSPLKYQIQQPEMKNSGWRFDKIDSMTLYFHKIGELNGSNYVKIPLRLNAILNIENSDNFCSLWSILANLHHYNTNHNNRITN